MNKNMMIGVALVALSAGLSVWVSTLRGSALDLLVGKAMWYVPYVSLVAGVDQLIRAIRSRGATPKTRFARRCRAPLRL